MTVKSKRAGLLPKNCRISANIVRSHCEFADLNNANHYLDCFCTKS